MPDWVCDGVSDDEVWIENGGERACGRRLSVWYDVGMYDGDERSDDGVVSVVMKEVVIWCVGEGDSEC